MAPFLPVRPLNRSQGLRLGTTGSQSLKDPTKTTYVDVGNGATRRDLAHHQAIGAVVVVGPLTNSTSTNVVVSGGQVTAQGTPDQTVAVAASELRNRDTGAYVTGAASPTLSATAAHATLARIDLVQVNTTTGAVTYKAGTAAATPAAPAADAGTIVLAQVARAANDNTISTGDITDVRPRP
jgi:hypothetical protein